jgi:hypothetical protein
MSSAAENIDDTVLVFVTRDYGQRPHISRVLTHAKAAEVYRRHVNPFTRRIPLGRWDWSPIVDRPVYVYEASAIGLTTELKDRLVNLSNSFVDRHGWFEVPDDYRDWLAQWEEARAAATPYIPAYEH